MYVDLKHDLEEGLMLAEVSLSELQAMFAVSDEPTDIYIEEQELAKLEQSLDHLTNATIALENLNELNLTERQVSTLAMVVVDNAVSELDVGLEGGVKDKLKAIKRVISRILRKIADVVIAIHTRYVKGAKTNLKKSKKLAKYLSKNVLTPKKDKIKLLKGEHFSFDVPDLASKGTGKVINQVHESTRAAQLGRTLASSTFYDHYVNGAIDALEALELHGDPNQVKRKNNLIEAFNRLGLISTDKFSKVDWRAGYVLSNAVVIFTYSKGSFTTEYKLVKDKSSHEYIEVPFPTQKELMEGNQEIIGIYRAVIDASPGLFSKSANRLEDYLTESVKNNGELSSSNVNAMSKYVVDSVKLLRSTRTQLLKLMFHQAKNHQKYLATCLAISTASK